MFNTDRRFFRQSFAMGVGILAASLDRAPIKATSGGGRAKALRHLLANNFGVAQTAVTGFKTHLTISAANAPA